jgi:hypothetical protein
MRTGLPRIFLCVIALLLLVATSFRVGPAAQVRPAPPHELLPTIQPVYDGWYKNSDGTLSFSYGYINRTDKPIDVPIGPDNGFTPTPADRGQPSVFQPGTERNAFSVILPGTFNQNLVWTIAYNGVKASTTEKGGQNPLYIISDVPPKVTPDAAPPRPESGPPRSVTFPGPTKLSATVRSNTVPGAKITYAWTKRSGPGEVTFDPPDALQTSATFSERGEYLLHLTVSRPSGMDHITGGADFKIGVK